jgi:hypothetical protein
VPYLCCVDNGFTFGGKQWGASKNQEAANGQ